MAIAAQYSQPPYDTLNSSPEILAAIEEIAEGEVHDEESEAYTVWAEPTDEQIKRVEELAWAMADDEETFLCWGETRIERKI